MKWLTFLVVCIACTRTTETKTDEHLALKEHGTTKAAEHSTEVVQTGPGRTVVYKFAPLEEKSGAGFTPASPRVGTSASSGSGVRPAAAAPAHQDHPAADGLPAHGALVEMDIIDTGSVVDTKANDSTASTCEDLGLNLTKHSERDTRTTPALSSWLFWILIAAGVVVVAGGVAWKFKPPWLTAAAAIFKRV